MTNTLKAKEATRAEPLRQYAVALLGYGFLFGIVVTIVLAFHR